MQTNTLAFRSGLFGSLWMLINGVWHTIKGASDPLSPGDLLLGGFLAAGLFYGFHAAVRYFGSRR